MSVEVERVEKTTSNGNSSLLKDDKRSRRNSSDSDGSPVTHMRIGPEYQASVPPLETTKKFVSRGPALTIWKPSKQLPDPLLLKYIELSRTKYGYREEQALGLLVCHGYNVEEANKDLANFVPYPDDWTTLEKQSFEHGFQEHGKDFHKIKMMLPDKSVSNIVKYYYIWKKTRSKYQTLKNKMKVKRNDSDDDSFDDGNEHKTKRIRMGSSSLLTSSFTPSQMPIIQTLYNCGVSNTPCTNCHRAKAVTVVTLKKEHLLCQECAEYFTKYTTMRPLFEISIVHTSPSVEKVILNPPEGIDLTLESLKLVANMKDAHRYLACLTNQIMTYKSQIQTKKQDYKQMKSKMKKLNIEQYRPEKETLNGGSSTRWTEEEIELFKMSLEKYGKDFDAASIIIGTRTATQVSSCFYARREKCDFEACVDTYENNNSEKSDDDEKEEDKMDTSEKTDDNEIVVISEKTPSKGTSSANSPTSSNSSSPDFVFKMQIGGITRPIRLQRLPITITSDNQQTEPMVIDLTDDENDSRPEIELKLTKNEPVKFVQNAVRKVISNIKMTTDDEVQILDYS